MPHAIITPDGQLRQVVPKLLPSMQLEPGERIAAYNQPAHDAELQTCTPVLPVPAEAQAVSFVVAEKPGAAATLHARRVAWFTEKIQARLDAFAATRVYDNVTSAAKYSDLTDAEINSLPAGDRAAVARYKAECRYLLLKTAHTWAVAERILAEVDAQTRPVPTTVAEIASELPALAWPG